MTPTRFTSGLTTLKPNDPIADFPTIMAARNGKVRTVVLNTDFTSNTEGLVAGGTSATAAVGGENGLFILTSNTTNAATLTGPVNWNLSTAKESLFEVSIRASAAVAFNIGLGASTTTGLFFKVAASTGALIVATRASSTDTQIAALGTITPTSFNTLAWRSVGASFEFFVNGRRMGRVASVTRANAALGLRGEITPAAGETLSLDWAAVVASA